MSLPLQNVLPQFELKLPSSEEVLTVRPFTVAEEKLLLIAKEANSEQAVVDATKQVVANCVISPKINIEKMPFFDVNYLFIALRAKSIGETMPMTFICSAKEKDSDLICHAPMEAEINVESVVLRKDPDVHTEIKIPGGFTVYMAYPSYTVMKTLGDATVIEKKVKLIASCVERLVDKNRVLTAGKDFTPGEMIKWVEGLTRAQFEKLEYFIDNQPDFYFEVNTKCPKCGTDHKIVYTDFEAFFR